MIQVHNLRKTFYHHGREFVAVDGVTFQVAPSEVYGLLGPNGAGKTTTLRMIIGLLRPDSGYAEVSGFRSDESSTAVKSRIGLVSASDGVYPWLSVRETLLFFADLYGLPVRRARERVRELGDLLMLGDFIDRRCAHLSTGQRQRVTLARALMHDPPVMLLDEPTRGLDVVGSQLVFDYIGTLRQRAKAVIVSTHRLDEAERFCDRFGLVHQGKLRYEGTLPELQRATGHQRLVEMFAELVPSTIRG
jgi:ABC-2 type transport system ATP-binding protein/sodium transport system ATP-binding protein